MSSECRIVPNYSKREKHTALIDCELLAKVYINLIDQKEPMLNFQSNIQEKNEAINTNVSYFKKIIKPSKEEILNHKSQVASQSFL